MANLVKWIQSALTEVKETEADIEAVVIGSAPYSKRDDDNAPKGIPLSWQKAQEYLNYQFDDGYGGVQCHAIAVYTKNWIFSVAQYDGSTDLFWIARNPALGEWPSMPGG